MYSKTIVVGRCGADPELSYLSSGVAVCNVRIAEDRGFGENKQTVWWRVAFWRQQAETVNEHVKKGDALVVEGVADAHAYLSNDGDPRASLELTAHSWRFAGGGRRGETDQSAADDGMPF